MRVGCFDLCREPPQNSRWLMFVLRPAPHFYCESDDACGSVSFGTRYKDFGRKAGSVDGATPAAGSLMVVRRRTVGREPAAFVPESSPERLSDEGGPVARVADEQIRYSVPGRPCHN